MSEKQQPPRPTVAGDMWRALEASADLVKRFKAEYGRPPSEIELRLAASMFIEIQRSAGRRALRKPKREEAGRA